MTRLWIACFVEVALQISICWKARRKTFGTLFCFKWSCRFRCCFEDKFSSQFTEVTETMIFRCLQWIFWENFVAEIEERFRLWWFVQIRWNVYFLWLVCETTFTIVLLFRYSMTLYNSSVIWCFWDLFNDEQASQGQNFYVMFSFLCLDQRWSSCCGFVQLFDTCCLKMILTGIIYKAIFAKGMYFQTFVTWAA